MNERDSETLAGFCENLGYVKTDLLGEADLVILNTCCVRANAENRIYGHIGNLKPLKQMRPEVIIAVCGCMAQEPSERERIKAACPHVDLIFGPQNLHEFPVLLERVLRGEGQVVEVDLGPGEIHEDLPVKRASNLKAWVTVMQGCNNFCAYCIVPYVRGRERSRRPERIVAEVEGLVAEGIKEVTLLGQNVNSYGRDLGAEGIDFAELVRRVDAVPGLLRLRFTTSHPKDLSDRLIAAMAECPTVCEHIHLPVQAGSDRILARMNRQYDRRRYLELVARLREAIPAIAITTDIIVGFPGETEEDFALTLSLVREVGFDGAFTFAYSPRLGTKAASMDGQVPEEVRQERLYRLIEVVNEVSRAKNEELRGKVEEVLVEGPSERNTAVWCGRTRGNKLVLFPGPAEAGTLLPVRITDPQTWTLHGVPAISK
ncbi:MAG: tRNA (N6-isopentenyl adenosine(37)-C2)-methylthiotransferase MiaB [Firmicutes bacterium]|nr:tRNA (N6-isopentenyl adenosine(37)-C2)-methylthiotransferase MiaB [Bacillota bacterium]